MNETSLLSTAQVAVLANVAPSSVKRWADEGLLQCEKTAGGHRRFRRMDVERFFASQRSGGSEQRRQTDAWVDLLLQLDPYALLGALYTARSRHGAWYRVADELGAALGRLGECWAKGKITVLDEHAATERLHRALGQVALGLTGSPAAPRALVLTLAGEEHTLGLSLAELCLKEAGWSVLWAGRRTPAPDVLRLLERTPVQMVAASASPCASPSPLKVAALEVGKACAARQIPFVLGGSGPWPGAVPAGVRVQSYGEFHGLLASLDGRMRS